MQMRRQNTTSERSGVAAKTKLGITRMNFKNMNLDYRTGER